MLDFIVFDYRNKYDMGGVLYQTGYKQLFFVDAELSTPEYEIEEDGTQDGDKNFLPTFRKTQKVYNIKFATNATMLDAVYFMQMHVSQFGEVYMQIKNEERALIKTMSVSHSHPKNAELSVVTMQVAVDYQLLDSENEYNINCFIPVRSDIAGIKTTVSQAQEIEDNSPYIFENVTGYANDVYIYTTGWTGQGLNYTGAVVEDTSGNKYYFDGVQFRRFPYISSYNADGSDFIIKGYIPPGTYCKLQYNSTGSYVDYTGVLTSGQFKNVGFTFTPPVPSVGYLLRIYCYDHNCSYGYSNVVNV